MASLHTRAALDSDAAGLIKLIGDCFSEYEGVFLEPDGLDADLQAYATYIEGIKGEAFVVEKEEELVAVSSYAPLEGNRYQLKRIYLSEKLRGSGMGLELLRLVERKAKVRGGASMELWSDTRFTRAHSFYQREGYVKQAYTRDLNDSSNTTEYCFIKTL